MRNVPGRSFDISRFHSALAFKIVESGKCLGVRLVARPSLEHDAPNALVFAVDGGPDLGIGRSADFCFGGGFGHGFGPGSGFGGFGCLGGCYDWAGLGGAAAALDSGGVRAAASGVNFEPWEVFFRPRRRVGTALAPNPSSAADEIETGGEEYTALVGAEPQAPGTRSGKRRAVPVTQAGQHQAGTQEKSEEAAFTPQVEEASAAVAAPAAPGAAGAETVAEVVTPEVEEASGAETVAEVGATQVQEASAAVAAPAAPGAAGAATVTEVGATQVQEASAAVAAPAASGAAVAATVADLGATQVQEASAKDTQASSAGATSADSPSSRTRGGAKTADTSAVKTGGARAVDSSGRGGAKPVRGIQGGLLGTIAKKAKGPVP